MGVLGLLVAGFFVVWIPIIKMSSSTAFEAIERRYVDHARVNHDEKTRGQYDFWKWWIVDNELHLWSMLNVARTVGIAFSLVVSAFCFGLAFYLRRLGRAEVVAESPRGL
jgi:hypothetical protein